MKERNSLFFIYLINHKAKAYRNLFGRKGHAEVVQEEMGNLVL